MPPGRYPVIHFAERIPVHASQTPVDEKQRLRELTTLSILDTPPEERFDRLTRLAARALRAPIALVSFVDRDRLWFKSRQGLSATQTSGSGSFCGHAILGEDALVVGDARDDARFADHPLVVGDPKARFYAGQPIHGPYGARIGTLCIIDRQPREFCADERAILADLAALVDRELALLEGATTDDLTRLANRRGFTQVAMHVLALCRRNRLPAVVVSLDLDNFKSVNDARGLRAGDEVLREFSSMLFCNFRESDVVARMGGDEFAVLCSGTTADQLAGSLERLREAYSLSDLATGFPALSFSAGLADFVPGTEDTVHDLLEAAAARLQAVKSAGKAAARDAP